MLKFLMLIKEEMMHFLIDKHNLLAVPNDFCSGVRRNFSERIERIS